MLVLGLVLMFVVVLVADIGVGGVGAFLVLVLTTWMHVSLISHMLCLLAGAF